MTKKQKRGLIILLTPIVLLVGVAILQIIVQFAFSGSDSGFAILLIVRIFSLVAGLIAVLGFVPCLIIGIIFLVDSGNKQNIIQHTASGPMPPATDQTSSTQQASPADDQSGLG